MEDVLYKILLIGGDALVALLAAGLTVLTGWLATKVKNERVKGIILRTDDVAMKVVRDVFQGFVEPLRKAGGALGEADKQEAKRRAIESAKGFIGVKGWNQILWLVNGDPVAAEKYVAAVVENAIVESKNLGKFARAVEKKAS